jgi:hypothetical protein
MRGWVPPKRRFLQEPHGVTSQKTPFFIVNAVKTSDLTFFEMGLYLCTRLHGVTSPKAVNLRSRFHMKLKQNKYILDCLTTITILPERIPCENAMRIASLGPG